MPDGVLTTGRWRRPEAVGGLTALVLAVVYLLLPRMGSDLSAQVARAGFVDLAGFAAVDLRWYGGVHHFGYSLTSQPVMALLGVRVTGALALIAASAAFAALLVRTHAPRPLLATVVGTLCIAGNLVSGRVTYGVGVAFGLAALLALTYRRGPAVAGVAGLLAGATSPVAGLFLGLAGVALLGARKYRAGAVLAISAAVPLAVTAGLFGDGGWMNISRTDTTRAVVTSLLVAVFVSVRPIRYGALLSAAGVLLAALVHTPVGLNATRLVVMFALPVLAGWGRPRRYWLAGLLVAVTVWQPPVSVTDVRDVGNPTADPAWFASLRANLDGRELTGRVEIPPTRNYWEGAYLGDVPLARGWLRQADIDRNPLFFTTVPGAPGTGVELTPDSYRVWLAEQAVQFVAVPAAELSWVGRREAELVTAGLPYLTEVWSDRRWRLYAVADPVPVVAAPGVQTGYTADAITFTTPAGGDVRVRVRHSRWLTADGGATVHADGVWTSVRVPGPGTYTLTS